MFKLKALVQGTAALFLCLFYTTSAQSQAELCKNCYIWEFTNEDGGRDDITKTLSNDFEDVLSQKEQCSILQRSKYASLYQQIKNEKAISSLSNASSTVRTELIKRAKNVVFGEVKKDYQGNISLRVSFEELQTTEIKSNTIFLIGEDAYNFDKRRKKISGFIDSFLGLAKPTQRESITNPLPVQPPIVKEFGDWKIILTSCAKKGSNILCGFIFESKFRDRQLYLDNNGNSYLYDDTGEEYRSRGRTLTGGRNPRRLIANIPTKGEVVFENISTKASKISLLELYITGDDIKGSDTKLQFRNVAISQ